MSQQSRVAHRFGGVWTEIKLRALTEYLDFYQNALKNKGFETWYIDVFAGTGDRHTETLTGGIFDGNPVETQEIILDGSARKALKIQPPFHHYWFSERHRRRCAALEALKTEFPYDISVRRGEANAELKNLISSFPWTNSTSSRRQRGVVFLDPYGMSVEWNTLAALANTKRIDVWYLFPRKAVVQQLARNIRGIDEAKRLKLTEIFGTSDWEAEFYQTGPVQAGLFDEPTQTTFRAASASEISAYARKRLSTLFCFVSQPLPLLVNGRDFFELYCLSNNKSAVSLIVKGVKHVVNKYAPASHHRYVH